MIKNLPISQQNSVFSVRRDIELSIDHRILWFGFGFNTQYQDKRFLEDWLESIGLVDTVVRPLRLIDRQCQHLDMCFRLEPNGELHWHPYAFDEYAHAVIESWYPETILMLA